MHLVLLDEVVVCVETLTGAKCLLHDFTYTHHRIGKQSDTTRNVFCFVDQIRSDGFVGPTADS